MALMNENTYHSSILWFLDNSASGNAPSVLSRTRVDRLSSQVIGFFTAYLTELNKRNNVDAKKADEVSGAFASVVKAISDANRNNLISAAERIKNVLADADVDAISARAVMQSLRNLVIELLDTAESLHDKAVTEEVVKLSRTFSNISSRRDNQVHN